MRILLVQTAFIGDCILSLPAVTALSETYPGAEIYVLTAERGRQVFQAHRAVKEVLTYKKSGFFNVIKTSRQLGRLAFDKVFSLHKSARTSILLALSGIPERIGFNESKLSFFYTRRIPLRKDQHHVVRHISLIKPEVTAEQAKAYQFGIEAPGLESLSESVKKQIPLNEKYALCIPGSVWKTKQLDPLIYREIVKRLIEQGNKVIITGAPNEVEVCKIVSEGLPVIDLSGKTKISEVSALIANAAIVLCNDSMALHFASAFKKKTVAFFCATILEFGCGPWNNDNAVVIEKKDLWCRPCASHGGNFCHTGSHLCRINFDIPGICSQINRLAPDLINN